MDCAVAQRVMGSGFGTGGLVVRAEFQSLAASTHPADVSGRVAEHEGVGWHIFRDDGPGPDEGKGPDVVATDNGGVGTNRSPTAYASAGILVSADHRTARVGDVGKNATRTEEDIVLAGDARVEADIVLDLAIPAQRDVWANHDVLADVAPLSQYCTGHDVAEMPNLGAGTDLTPRVDHGRFVGEPILLSSGGAHLL